MADSKLYSIQLLGLATSLSAFPYSGTKPFSFEARSQTCGSVVGIEVATDPNNEVKEIGLKVQACAVGQAAAAIMADAAAGKTHSDFAEALGEIEEWLSGAGKSPQWPQFDPLLPVLQHKGRHGALLLPWQAANGALSLAKSTG